MSYDLYMLEPVAGEDPMDTLERLTEAEEAAPPDTATEERNRRIADALLAANGRYTEYGIGDRSIELNDEDGLQVMLSDEQAAISFPYWDSLDSKALVDQIAKASRVIGDATGWRLYDPQLEKFLDPVADYDAFAEAFDVGVEHVQRVTAEDPPPSPGERPSLWRRMLGRR